MITVKQEILDVAKLFKYVMITAYMQYCIFIQIKF